MPDRLFAEPRLAAVYDALDPDRRDLDVYVELLVDEPGVGSVVDVGCGTGTLAIMLAARGVDVTAVDPAEASLAVAVPSPAENRSVGRWATRGPVARVRSTRSR